MQQEMIISPARPLEPATWVGLWDSGHGATHKGGGDLLPTKTSREGILGCPFFCWDLFPDILSFLFHFVAVMLSS
ncbi:hypothetical protein BC827DRAFT_1241959, partial [Russula dissimulans]